MCLVGKVQFDFSLGVRLFSVNTSWTLKVESSPFQHCDGFNFVSVSKCGMNSSRLASPTQLRLFDLHEMPVMITGGSRLQNSVILSMSWLSSETIYVVLR